MFRFYEKTFTVRFTENARQRRSLLCVFLKRTAKKKFCRAFFGMVHGKLVPLAQLHRPIPLPLAQIKRTKNGRAPPAVGFHPAATNHPLAHPNPTPPSPAAAPPLLLSLRSQSDPLPPTGAPTSHPLHRRPYLPLRISGGASISPSLSSSRIWRCPVRWRPAPRRPPREPRPRPLPSPPSSTVAAGRVALYRAGPDPGSAGPRPPGCAMPRASAPDTKEKKEE
jgi:hypothetical protein